MLGPRQRRELPRWVPLVALALGVLIMAGGALWRFWPRPIEPLSLAELQNTYAGMVRADGTNDASVMTRQTVTEIAADGDSPTACAPLVQATVANRFPDAALGRRRDLLGRPQQHHLAVHAPLRPTPSRPRPSASGSAPRSTPASIRQIFVRRTQAPSSVQAWRATVGRTETGTGADGQLGYTLTGRSRRSDGHPADAVPEHDQLAVPLRDRLRVVLDAARRPADAVTALPAGRRSSPPDRGDPGRRVSVGSAGRSGRCGLQPAEEAGQRVGRHRELPGSSVRVARDRCSTSSTTRWPA